MSKTQTETKHRLLKISILRYNPQDPDSVPHMQTYELEEGDSYDPLHRSERSAR